MSVHADRADAGPAPTVRNAERLVHVQVAHVRTTRSWARETALGLRRSLESRFGPNSLKIERKTTHVIVRWRRVHPRQGRRLVSRRRERAFKLAPSM